MSESRVPRPRSIYVASSWRNRLQPLVVTALRAAGHEVYDFRNPPGGTGFAWSEVGLTSPSAHVAAGEFARVDDFLAALKHPRAVEGFRADFEAMKAADTFVLVLPCGRSAHLELGWAAGAGKRTAVLLDEPCVPELMYAGLDYLAPSMANLMEWLAALSDLEDAAVTATVSAYRAVAELATGTSVTESAIRSTLGFPPAGDQR